MAKLIEETPNSINAIKSTTAFSADVVLKQSRAKAKKISQDTGATVPPAITRHAEAQEEANRLNQYSQAVVGVKDRMEAFIAQVRHDVLNTVLIDADGVSPKGINDFQLSDLAQLIISGANRPKAGDVLQQLIQALTMPFDHCKKVATNIKIFKSKAAQVQAYGIISTLP
jgi:hypothetical protein